jgi:hypothetical protein
LQYCFGVYPYDRGVAAQYLLQLGWLLFFAILQNFSDPNHTSRWRQRITSSKYPLTYYH